MLLEEEAVGVEVELEKELDREFALAVHRRAMVRLEKKYVELGKAERFVQIRQYVLGEDPAESYAMVAGWLDMNPNNLKKAVFDMRERYCDCLQLEVAEVTPPEAVEEEMHYLIQLLAEAEPGMVA